MALTKKQLSDTLLQIRNVWRNNALRNEYDELHSLLEELFEGTTVKVAYGYGDPIAGQEAEDLRRGIKALLEEFDAVDAIPNDEVEELLDRIDARDALAFLENKSSSSFQTFANPALGVPFDSTKPATPPGQRSNTASTGSSEDEDLADTIIARLNALCADDVIQGALEKLIELTVSLPPEAASHLTVQVRTKENSGRVSCSVGFLGVLNGLVGVIPIGKYKDWGYIAAVYNDAGTLEKFVRTDKPDSGIKPA